MSIFSEDLQKLTRSAGKISRATIKENDFTDLQKLRDKIQDQYTIGYINQKEYRILQNTAAYLIDEARETLRVNAELKRISRQINQARRAEAKAQRPSKGGAAENV